MTNSSIEKEFIQWCQSLHTDFKAYTFIQRHSRYSTEYIPFFEKALTSLHEKICQEKPNIDFYFRARTKSKRSFLIKTFVTIAENIVKLFPDEIPKDPKELEKRDKAIETFFKFLIKENPEKYQKISNMIKQINPVFNSKKCFNIIFSELTPDEQEKLVTRLGRTEDAFAFRAIVRSVDFNISSATKNENNTFEIKDEEGNIIPIRPAAKFNPETDLIEKENGSKYIIIDGKEILLDERNLLYPQNLKSSQRTLHNAQKDSDGNLTLLYDSIVIDSEHKRNREVFDIISISTNPDTNDIIVHNQYGESKNLRLLLTKNIKLKKSDDEYTKPALYDILNLIESYYRDNKIVSISSRFKDYVKLPKPFTNYMSIHISAFNKLFGYTIESQIRTQKMEDDAKNEDSALGHDKYKENKLEKYKKNSILSEILEANPLSFDSSTPTLLKILDNKNIELSELLPTYLLFTKVHNGSSACYQSAIDKAFDHTFQHTKHTVSNDTSAPPLDTSNYENFIISRSERLTYLYNDSPNGPDVYAPDSPR